MKTIAFLLITIVLLGFASAAAAQCSVDNAADCTVNELQDMLAVKARRDAVDAAVNETADKVENSNRATTAPDPFAARLHSSYQDFLVPLSFALNDVIESEDGRALILRFNPLREPPFVAGLTVTAAKPELDERISAAVPEDGRDAAVKRLEGEFEDLGDVTFAGSFAFESDTCESDKTFCWGRNPRTYDQLLSSSFRDLAIRGLEQGTEGQPAFDALVNAARAAKTADGTPLGVNRPLHEVVDATQRQQLIDLIDRAVAADQHDSAKFLDFLSREGIDQLAALLDNQPQFAITATFHDRDLTAGPGEKAFTLEYQFGFSNLNAVKRGCTGTFTDCLASTLRTAVQTKHNFSDKLVLSASYKDVSRYNVTGDNVGVTGFTAIDVPSHREVSVKLQWGRRLQTRIMNQDQLARIDVNAEGIRIIDGDMRKKNDWTGTATLTIPLMKNMSLPLSLKYGNRRELLGDVDDELSAHFGISYRLPWEMEKFKSQ